MSWNSLSSYFTPIKTSSIPKPCRPSQSLFTEHQLATECHGSGKPLTPGQLVELSPEIRVFWEPALIAAAAALPPPCRASLDRPPGVLHHVHRSLVCCSEVLDVPAFTTRSCTKPLRPGTALHVPISDALHEAVMAACNVVSGHTLFHLLARICGMNEFVNE